VRPRHPITFDDESVLEAASPNDGRPRLREESTPYIRVCQSYGRGAPRGRGQSAPGGKRHSVEGGDQADRAGAKTGGAPRQGSTGSSTPQRPRRASPIVRAGGQHAGSTV